MSTADLIAEVIAYNADAEDSHYDGCYQRHAGCLAVMLRDMLREPGELAAHNAEVAAKAWGEGKAAGVEHERMYEKYRTGELSEKAYVRQSERLTRNPYRKAVES